MSAPPPLPEPVRARRRAARPKGRRGGAGRRAGGRRGRRGERGYLDGVGRLLESDQHVPVSPAGRVPGSELRRGDKAEGEARGGAGTPPARRCPPPPPVSPAAPAPPARSPPPPPPLSLALASSRQAAPVPSWKSLQRLWLCPDRWCPDGCAGSWRRTCLSGRVRWA